MLNNMVYVDVEVITGVLAINLVVRHYGIWPYSLVTFPGTLAHELCHFFVALVFFASPSLPSLFPKKTGNTWTMGSVSFRPTLLNSIPVALAPFALLPAGMMVWLFLMHQASGWEYFAWGWVAGNMLFACLPSRQDWKIAMPALLFFSVISGLAWYFAHRYG